MTNWCLTECRAVTQGPKHHYFGYYDKCPWDVSGRYLLAMETDFMDRPPTPDDRARIGVIDLEGRKEFEPVAETHAFNWQQGTHLQWLPGEQPHRIAYNVRKDDRYMGCIHDLDGDNCRYLSRPIYAISHDGEQALSVNFSRLHDCRPSYGYNGIPDPWAEKFCPEDDGIVRINLATGEEEMIISLYQIASIDPSEGMASAKHWFNHLQFSTDCTRFVFLHRWRVSRRKQLTLSRIRTLLSRRALSAALKRLRKEGLSSHGHCTRMFTAAPDGSGVHLLNGDDMTSHFDWFDANHVLAWARRFGIGDHYYLFTDRSGEVQTVGAGVLDCDGHCTYSPDRRHVLTDTYPQGPQHMRAIIVYNSETGTRTDVGAFYSPPEFQGEIRCDLHPRWSRDGRKVCFDSMHEGTRQMYEIDVGEIVDN